MVCRKCGKDKFVEDMVRNEHRCKYCKSLHGHEFYVKNKTQTYEKYKQQLAKHPLQMKLISISNHGGKTTGLLPILEAKYRNSPYCRYCNVFLSATEVSLDHIIPVSRGGSANDPNNLGISCYACNRLKWRMTADEFQVFLKEYMKRLEGQFLAKPEREGVEISPEIMDISSLVPDLAQDMIRTNE